MICNLKGLNDILQNAKLDYPPKFISIEAGAASKSKALLAKYSNIIIICDDNTKMIAQAIFTTNKIYSLGTEVKPTFKNVNYVIDVIKEANLLVAVGSGTINDICKYAASLQNIDYFIYATAPSMNGYCTATVSLISDDNNHKKSYPANIPTAIIMDLEMISAAPMRLIKSGIGDLLCRCSVFTDWLIGSELFESRKFKSEFHTILKKYEKELLTNIEYILKRDIRGLQKMCEIIVVQGIMMCIDNSSNPASQSEHMIAHLYNQLSNYKVSHTHGEEIALTTTMMLNLQKQILASDELVITISNAQDYKDLPYLNSKLAHYKKVIASGALSNDNWQEIKLYITAIISNENEEILNAIKKVGLPNKIIDLNWDKKTIVKAINEAVFYRDRYTILDIALLTGHLKKFLELNFF